MVANRDHKELQAALAEFVAYRQNYLTGDERGEAQVFLDRFFRALGHDGLREAGATLEMRVKRRDNGGTAFADLVWKPRVLIEMKKAGQDLARHYRQAFEYWIDLVPDRPAYVILCNFDELWIYDLNKQLDEPMDRVKLVDLPNRTTAVSFMLPVEERPLFENDLVEVTRDVAAHVAGLFNQLIDRGVPRGSAQRFILQCVMAMFAEDIDLLPSNLFQQALRDSQAGASAYDLIFGLFEEMNRQGNTPAGRYKGTPYFNGGLFRKVERFDLLPDEVETLFRASLYDWKAVRPAIFGTLFETSLGQEERHAYGAHFTSEADIQKIVLPTIVRPWRQRIEEATTIAELGAVENDMLHYRVLDPACGCGNFLYIAYRELRRLERQLSDKLAQRRRRTGEQQAISFVSTLQFFGIDINSFAVEIAKVTLMLARKLAAEELGDEQQVLPLDDLDANFRAADALDVTWPRFDACIGNPPYLGRRRIADERGADYSAWLAERYPEVGGVSDYVVYWFRLAHDQLPEGGRAGLVATNTIRQTDTRKASLDYILDNDGDIYDAVSSQPWSGDAGITVSIVNWAKGTDIQPKTLWLANGTVRQEVPHISGALSPNVDLRTAAALQCNRRPKRYFQGQTPGNTEAFVVPFDTARSLATAMADGESVIHPFLVGDELLHDGRPSRAIIDLDADDPILARRQCVPAFERIRQMALPLREENAQKEADENAKVLRENPKARVNWHHRGFLNRWWKLSYRREEMLEALNPLDRYIALSRVASVMRRPAFTFVSPHIRPSDAVQVFAFDDDYSFGILQSSIHRDWFHERCSTLRRDLRYTSGTVWDSFPWPQAPTDFAVRRVVNAVSDLLAFREDRLSKGVSLADQYNSMQSPGRNPLADLHEELDAAVLEAYAFSRDDDLLAQLLALNLAVASASEDSDIPPRAPGPIGLRGTRVTDYAVRFEL